MGFIFNERLKTYDELSKRLNMNGFDKKSIIEDGKTYIQQVLDFRRVASVLILHKNIKICKP